MCGIAGSIHFIKDPERLAQAAGDFQRSLKHRGPDSQGLWFSPSQPVALVHTRLAILDLSDSGRQPMQSADGRYTIVFNGEIYNFRELRASLAQEGTIFYSESDTEVLLHLYARVGEKMLPHLRGMFAFCIWDEWEQRAFMARDPLGIKPFYYAEGQGGLLFASELSALRKSGLISNALSRQGLAGYLEMGSVQAPHTLLEAARVLPAGHSLQWHQGQTQLQSYWYPQFPEAVEMSREEAVKCVREALIESLDAHLVSDVPVGVFLSGGIDSTVLAGLIKTALGKNMQSFSIGVDSVEFDETELSTRTAAHFGLQHQMLRLNGDSAAELFDGYLRSMDQPSIDGLNPMPCLPLPIITA
jgi:asparagine synthase (glutamine-hydrolysing)